jgi:hypothetical protein
MATWRLGDLCLDPAVLGGGRTRVAPEDIAALRADLDLECAVAQTLDASDRPLRLPKARIADVLACEGFRRATVVGEPNTRLVLGRIADLLLGSWIGGHSPECAADGILALLEAHGEVQAIDWWRTADQAARLQMVNELQAVVDGFSQDLGRIAPEWGARTQGTAATGFAQGAVICSAVFDLELGGPPTDIAAAIIDMKIGSAKWATSEHAEDLFVYALLAAFRDGRAPAWVATWYAEDRRLEPHPVSLGTLQSAARRVALAVSKTAELLHGREPKVKHGWRCRWCAHATTCPEAHAADDVRIEVHDDTISSEDW